MYVSDEKQELERLKRQIGWARYEAERQMNSDRIDRHREQERRAEELDETYGDIEDLGERLGKIEAFLKKRFNEEWDSFEVKP